MSMPTLKSFETGIAKPSAAACAATGATSREPARPVDAGIQVRLREQHVGARGLDSRERGLEVEVVAERLLDQRREQPDR
jgi:hypothetical protein